MPALPIPPLHSNLLRTPWPRLVCWLASCRQRCAAAWRAQRRRGEDRRILQDMSERDLRDIGLGRGDVPYVTGRRHDGASR
jgi:uncharacterized protein YjiS (DUF1127 family)